MSDQPPTRERTRDRSKRQDSGRGSSDTQTETTGTEDVKTCPECGSQVTENNSKAERTCVSCGLVIESGNIDHGPEWRAFDFGERESKSRVGPGRTELRHDRGLSTTIDWKDRDVYGNQLSASKRAQMQRLRTWDKRAKQDSGERGMAYANGEIMRMGSALGAPQSTLETAGALYRQCQETGLVPGRSIEGMASAVLYIALRVHDTPRSLDEVAQVSRVERKPISRAHRYICRELDIPLKPTNPVKYIPRFAGEIGVSQEIIRTAEQYIRDIDGYHMSGCDPTVLAGAALYAASIVHGELITQHSVKDAADVTEVSIRNNYKQFLSHVDSVDLTEKEVSSIDSPMGLCKELNGELSYNQETRNNSANSSDTDTSEGSSEDQTDSQTETGDSNGDTVDYPNSEYNFECTACDSIFETYLELRVHTGRQHNLTEVGPQEREDCAIDPSKKSKSSEDAETEFYPASTFNFYCHHCNTVFDTYQGLGTHTGHVHSDEETPRRERSVAAVPPLLFPETAPNTESCIEELLAAKAASLEFRQYVIETLAEIDNSLIEPKIMQFGKTLLLIGGENPVSDTSRKPAGSIGAAIYAAHRILDNKSRKQLTQAEIAELMDTSTRPISNHYHDYIDLFNDAALTIPDVLPLFAPAQK